MAKQYRSETMSAIHETAEGLHSIGLMDKQTMRQFDDACLTPVHPLSAAEIRALREREGASQAVFARYLGSPDDLFKIVRQQVGMPSSFPDMCPGGAFEPEIPTICRLALNWAPHPSVSQFTDSTHQSAYTNAH